MTRGWHPRKVVASANFREYTATIATKVIPQYLYLGRVVKRSRGLFMETSAACWRGSPLRPTKSPGGVSTTCTGRWRWAARWKTRRAVLVRHALRNAAVPIITVIGIGIALLIGGVVVTESVFNIPGLVRLTVDAVLARDYPVIQAIILVFSYAYVQINLAIDLAYSFFDPRIRY